MNNTGLLNMELSKSLITLVIVLCVTPSFPTTGDAAGNSTVSPSTGISTNTVATTIAATITTTAATITTSTAVTTAPTIPTTTTFSPPIPSDVVPTRANPSGTNITLEWTYNDTHVVSGFRLNCIPAVGLCGDRNSPLDIPDNSSRTYTLQNATRGQSYAVSIQAYVNTTSGSVQSGWVDFNEVEPGLSSPENLVITERRDTSVTLKWDESTGMANISYYEVSYTDSDGTNTSANTARNFSLIIDNLTEGHGYTFVVKSVSSTGKRSPQSNEVKYTVAPTIPESVEVKTPPGSSMLSFTWSLGSGRRDRFETVLFTPEGNMTDTVFGNTTFKEYSSLSPDTIYSFTVRAQAADVERPGYYKYSNYTERVDNTTDEDKPSPVADLTATGATSSSVTLTWNKPVQENGVVVAYVIQTILLSNSTCVSSTLISCEDCRRREHNYTAAINEKVVECTNRLDDVIKKSADFSSISYTVTKLSAFTNYKFVVWAFNTKEPSLGEENATTTAKPPNAPDTVNTLSYTHSSIYINWTSVSSEGVGVIEGYRISVQPSHTAPIDISADDPLEYNITDLEPYTEYTVSVQAKTSAGYGAPRDIHQRTKQYLPPKPILNNPSAGIDNSGSKKSPYIDISWKEPSPPNGVVTGYRIQWAEVLNPPSSGAKTKVVNSTARNYRITSDLSHNKKYTVSIQARTEYLQNSPEGWGEAATRTVSTLESTPTAVPKVSDEVKEQLSVEEQISKISFYLPSDVTTMFSLDSGNIIKYQILVIGQVSNQQFREDKLSKAVPGIASWAEAKKGDFKEPYAISAPTKSPPDWPTNSNRKKRAAASNTQINVGTDSSCKDGDTRLCNGPLKSNQQYCVYVRGFTSAGYSDSDCIVEAKTKLNPTPIIIGVVVAVALLVILVGAIYVLRQRRIGPFKREKIPDGPETPPIPLPTVTSDGRPSTPPPQAVKLVDFVKHTSSMHKDQDFRFSQEYQKVRDLSAKHTHNAAVSGPNTSKNRWVDILPFDHSRVKLLPADEEEGSDYINANYMPGYTSKREYIATQGPLPGTIDHFWRMIWEQNVTMIVMLTQLIERGRRKCEQYWPDTLEEPAAYGDLVVTKRAESVLPEYTIRIFDIQMGETTRSVKQFFVSFWPDFGCPDRTESLLNLVRVVRSHMRPEGRGPLVVHCSAGVGRTGTYVAVDRLLQRIQDHDEIDIFSLVMEMREYRCRMVQTEDQYIYIHDCIKEALLSSMSKRYTPLPQDDENDDGPIYENASVQSPVLDTQMVSLAIDANGSSEPSGNVKNTEL